MAVRMLVITPQPAFGELIRQSLEQTGNYQVMVSQSLALTGPLFKKNAFDLAILDTDIGIKTAIQLGQSIRSLQPGIKLMVIPPNQNGDRALVEVLQPQGYLSKPFYLPDLVDTVGKVMAGVSESKEPEAAPQPESNHKDEPPQPDEDNLGESETIPKPNPIEQLHIAESWFREAEGKTIPLSTAFRSNSISEASDTAPISIRIPHSPTHIEPRPAALSKPVYTTALVPRMPQHYLSGDLATKLGQWIPQLCRAFGWNLEGLSIRPDYMQWIVRIPPSMSPGKMLRVVRERTSQRIFTDFQQLSLENPSGSFWAPSFLLVSGAQSLPQPVLHRYVNEIRQRQ